MIYFMYVIVKFSSLVGSCSPDAFSQVEEALLTEKA